MKAYASFLVAVLMVGCGGAQTPTTPAEPAPETPAATEPAPPAEPAAPAEAAAPAPAADAAPAAATPVTPATPEPAAPAAPGTPAAPAAAGKPMNLKALPATWSREQVVAYMKKNVVPGLGVKCDFCHVKDDFAADTEHKTIAVGMIKMVNELNKKHFKGQPRLGCVTCHNGKAEPDEP